MTQNALQHTDKIACMRKKFEEHIFWKLPGLISNLYLIISKNQCKTNNTNELLKYNKIIHLSVIKIKLNKTEKIKCRYSYIHLYN